MLLTTGLDEKLPQAERAVVVGAFDGLHIGHQYLIRRTCAEAAARGLESTVLTFEPIPEEVLAPPDNPGMRLTVEAERLDLLRELRVDRVVVAEFHDQFSALSAQEFTCDILAGHLSTKVLLAAENHTFGSGAEADINAIGRLAEKYAFELVIVPLLKLDGSRVSSTQVRKYLREAHAEEAAALLARHYSLRGKVVPGVGTGRKLGLPTVNLEVPPNKLIPASAVYAGLADGSALRRQIGPDAAPCPAAINLGPQPTFGRSHSTIEAHIITEHDLDLVGSQLDLSFVRRLRFVEKFPDARSLKAQIARDVQMTRRFVGHGDP